MYVCMYLKGSVNYDQAIGVFVFFHKTECVNMVLRTLNLERQQNCMIGSKVKKKTFFFQKKNYQTFQL